MTEISYSSKLRDLSKQYYQSHLGFEEYRSQRKLILDKIDEEFNGRKTVEHEQSQAENASVFMKTIAFFKNNDIDE